MWNWQRGGERREEKIYWTYFHVAYQFGLTISRSVYSKKTWCMCYKNTNEQAVAFEVQHRWAVIMEGRFALIRCIQKQRLGFPWQCDILKSSMPLWIYVILRHPPKCPSWQAIWIWCWNMTATFSVSMAFFKGELNWFHNLHTYLTDILKEKLIHRYFWQVSEVYFSYSYSSWEKSVYLQKAFMRKIMINQSTHDRYQHNLIHYKHHACLDSFPA